MDGVLSQEEINALLNEPGAEASDSAENELSDAQKDAIGEIANISMGLRRQRCFRSLIIRWKFQLQLFLTAHGMILYRNTKNLACLSALHIRRTGWK